MPSARFYYRDPNAPLPNQPIGIGALALIERDGALLLERRSDSGQWGFVGGRVDMGESLGEALCREVREETGLTVTGYTLFGTFSDPSRIAHYPDGNIVRAIGLVYRVEVDNFDALRRSDESTALQFFTREELPHLDLAETMRPILDRYLATPRPQAVILE